MMSLLIDCHGCSSQAKRGSNAHKTMQRAYSSNTNKEAETYKYQGNSRFLDEFFCTLYTRQDYTITLHYICHIFTLDAMPQFDGSIQH